MRPSDTLRLMRVSGFAVTATAMLLAILAQAMAGSYMALLAVERAAMTPFELSAFLTLSAISGIGTTTLLGNWFDREHKLRPALLSLAALVLGYGLCSVVTERWPLLVIAFLLLGPASAAFALLFALAKGHLDLEGAAIAARGMAALRMISSLSWAIGPALGALLIGVWGYPGVFGGAAACGVLALVMVFAGGRSAVSPVMGGEGPVPVPTWRVVGVAASALALFHMAMFMGSNALPIVVVRKFGGSERDVGLLFSLCAAIEVVVMATFVVRPVKHAGRGFVAVGLAVFAAYFLSAVLLPALVTLYWAQFLRAIGIGIVSVIGMLLVQEMMPDRPGAASALFANTANAGWLLSGITTGLWAEAFGYWSIFGLCAGLSILAAALLLMPEQTPARSAEARGHSIENTSVP